MNTLTLSAPAKINLTLDVLGKRPDGYHDLKMVMHSVGVCDQVTLTLTGAPGIRLRTNLSWLPADGNNIAVKAANAFFAALNQPLPGLEIAIEKHIPVCAGTAGGSSDGAAVLRGLNQLFDAPFTLTQLAQIGESVGSDVPYCVMGGTALAEGRGERLTPLPSLPHCWLVLCKPPFPVSTPELFGRLDGLRLRTHPDTEGMLTALHDGDLSAAAQRMFNVFEDVLPPGRQLEIREIRDALLECGALGACMSGTGPTVFGLFQREDTARAAYARLRRDYRDTFLTENL